MVLPAGIMPVLNLRRPRYPATCLRDDAADSLTDVSDPKLARAEDDKTYESAEVGSANELALASCARLRLAATHAETSSTSSPVRQRTFLGKFINFSFGPQ